MPGLLIDTTDQPQFLFEKFSESGATDSSDVASAMLALVEATGFDIVFGRIFRWKVDDDAKSVIEASARELLESNGLDLDRFSTQQALTLGATRVIMCHEAYVMDTSESDDDEVGEADMDIVAHGLEKERQYMVGIGRIHEDNLATLISNTGCMVTTTNGMMNAMYGMSHKRIDTGAHHSLVLFYDMPENENSVEGNNSPDQTTEE